MITGAETVILLKAISSEVKEIQKSQKKMDEQLDKIQNKLNRIEEKLDEAIIRKFRAANQSLKEGITSESQYIRELRVGNAINKFDELIGLNENESTNGTSGKIDNKYLIALSYLGKFYGYASLGDRNNAARQVYECVHRYVHRCVQWDDILVGIGTFPPEFFSKNYKELLNSNLHELSDINERLKQDKQSNFNESVVYNVKRGTKAVGIGICALAGAGIVGGLLWNVIKIDTPHLHNVDSLKTEALKLEANLASLTNQLNEECENKLQFIDSSAPNSLIINAWQQLLTPLIIQTERSIEKNENHLPISKQNGLENEIAKLKDGLKERNISSLTQSINKISEMVKSVSGLVEEWKGLYNNLEECGLLS